MDAARRRGAGPRGGERRGDRSMARRSTGRSTAATTRSDFDGADVTIVNTGNQPTEAKVSVDRHSGDAAGRPAARASPSARDYYLPDGTPVDLDATVSQNDRFVVVLTMTADARWARASTWSPIRCRPASRSRTPISRPARGVGDSQLAQPSTRRRMSESRTDQYVAAFRYGSEYRRASRPPTWCAPSRRAASCCPARRSRTCTGPSCAANTDAGSVEVVAHRSAVERTAAAHRGTARRAAATLRPVSGSRLIAAGSGPRRWAWPSAAAYHGLRACVRRHRGGAAADARSRRPCRSRPRWSIATGLLLRPFTIADGRWRLPVTMAEVDPRFLDMLIAYEDRHFAEHDGIDWPSMLRAAGQFVGAGGHIVSGGSTLTMQVARLIEGEPTRSLDGKLRQMVHADAARAAAQQGRDPHPLPDARALWRQYRGHPRRQPRLFRQGADAADHGRGGAARRAAAIARGAPARPRSRSGARRRATACSTAWSAPGVIGAGGGRGRQERADARRRAATSRCSPRISPRRRSPAHPDARAHRADHRPRPAGGARAARRRPRRALGPKVSVAIVVADQQTGEILASVGSAGLFDDRERRLSST